MSSTPTPPTNGAAELLKDAIRGKLYGLAVQSYNGPRENLPIYANESLDVILKAVQSYLHTLESNLPEEKDTQPFADLPNLWHEAHGRNSAIFDCRALLTAEIEAITKEK